METSRREQLTTTIQEQGDLGFSKREIIENLSATGATHEELKELKLIIQEHAVDPAAKSNIGLNIFSMLVSFVLIIRGIYLFNRGITIWAILMIAIGLFGLVLRISQILKNKKRKSSYQ